MLSFRVTPRKDRLDVFVTKSDLNKDLNLDDLADMGDVSSMSPEEFFKTLEQSMREKGDTQANEKLEKVEEMMEDAVEATDSEESSTMNPLEYVHYVLDFETIEDVIRFSKTVDYMTEASELYKENQRYYMTILLDLKDKPEYFANVMYARMLEHAKPGTKTRAYLQEHGILLVDDQAIDHLKTVKLV